MTTKDIHKLVSLIEDVICQRVDIDEFEDIMPKVSQLMYNRYCTVKIPDQKIGDCFKMFNEIKNNIQDNKPASKDLW